jgi:hypothetical protein
MQQIVKNPQSKILKENYQYPKHKKQILAELLVEQGEFCAYCEDRISSAMAVDVEHFNPYLKGTAQDGYENWFAVSHQINMHKGTKNAKSRWDAHQPLANLTDATLNNRILYDSGFYYAEGSQDVEIKNLLNYLLINSLNLPNERDNYIKKLKALFDNVQELEDYLREFPSDIRFPRAIEHEFGIKV